MIYFHSALYGHFHSSFDYYDWNKLKGSEFSYLLPFDMFLDSKFRVSEARVKNVFEYIDKHLSVLPDMRLMLDCGAFTAFRKGFEIDVHCYIDFIKKYRDRWFSIVALDKINNPQGTWENYLEMRNSGINNVILVYHVSEPIEVLYKYVENCEYLGFSPPFGLSGDTCIDVYQAQLYEDDGSLRFPNTKFHGFGVGSPLSFQVYPWYSCDSSNSAIFGRYGSILYYDYDNFLSVKLRKVFVSSQQKKKPLHYNYLSPGDKQFIDREFLKLGFSIDDFDEDRFEDNLIDDKYALRKSHANRVLYNIIVSNNFVDKINSKEVRMISPPVRLL